MARSGKAGSDKPDRLPLSPLIHGQVRLLIMATLVRSPKAHLFVALRDSLGLTDGSLSANLSKLETAGLVKVEKTFAGKRPQTLIRVTDQGRRRFAQYVADLRALLPAVPPA